MINAKNSKKERSELCLFLLKKIHAKYSDGILAITAKRKAMVVSTRTTFKVVTS